LREEEITVIRMFGINQEGNSFALHVYNFRPYFYLQLPKNMHLYDSPEDLADVRKFLASKLPNPRAIVEVVLHERGKQSLLKY